MLKQNIFSLLGYPLIEPIEGGNTHSVIRCSFVVQRRQGWETAELPASLQSMPVVHLQGEEGCLRLPYSLLDPFPVLPLLEFVVDLLKSSIVAESGGEM